MKSVVSRQLLRISFAGLLGFSAIAASSLSANADPLLASPFDGDYQLMSLGSAAGVPANYGGLIFLSNDTLLLGGAANGPAGAIYSVSVTRDADNHINGFAGTATVFSTAPFIDGGLAYGPGGVLFFTGYANNTIGQIKPGSTIPDRIDTAPAELSSLGTLNFVPSGFGGAGKLVVGSYSNGTFGNLALTPDGSGTYDLGALTNTLTLPGGPEGFVYVSSANPLFDANSMLVAEYSAGKVAAYEVDANGLPIVDSRVDFITGLIGAEGAVIDPVTGDFLFSTFGGGNQIIRVSGFVAPTPPTGDVPLPGAVALFPAGLGLVAFLARRKKKSAA